MAPVQRLTVCLDGTWNRQDSSTNVLHQFNLVLEGCVTPGIVQKKYYHLGVGTGVLDSMTGGGFGFGLEANVRDAYNWLVTNYCDHADNRQDEIYIFGFSRGAYTARSLIGFIGQCGLLRRGAPITVQQLWSAYCLLGRQKEDRQSIWEKILGSGNVAVSPLTDLARQRNLSEDQRLLLKWSRRVPIKYVGIYDTVGAIGWDALAIPGLTSRLALHNNIRPTTLIQNCRHALAIDEHRSNFNHTPFVAYLQENSEELERAESLSSDTPLSIELNRDMWKKRIEQRWFVGAHSNIGGGYDNNRLAQLPLYWIMEGATGVALETEPPPRPEPLNPDEARPRDSHAEFAPPLWETMIRNKRNYRIIDSAPKLRARADGKGPGFALETINEQLDSSVLKYWRDSKRPIPPNLECYLKRLDTSDPLKGLQPARHTWLKETWFSYTAVVVWAVLATFGVFAVNRLGGFREEFAWWFAGAVAILLPLLDWAESKVTFRYAVGAGGPRARAFLDAVYWARTLGFVLFGLGAIYGICVLLADGWRSEWPLTNLHSQFWLIPFVAALPGLIITQARSKFAWIAFVLGPAVVFLVAILMWLLGAWVHALFPEIRASLPHSGPGDYPSLPGLLVLLQLSGIYVWRSLLWVAEPLSEANLGSITKLQRCWTPAQVIECLDRWRNKLANTTQPDTSRGGQPAVNLREILRHGLWRDIIGFIPVYTGFLLLGLWFAKEVVFERPDAIAQDLRPGLHSILRFWWVLPVLAAAADYLEDICHLRYCKVYENTDKNARPSAALTTFSFLMTMIKNVAFVTSVVITALAVLVGTYSMRTNLSDWKAKIAVTLTIVGIAAIILVLIGAGAIRIRHSTKIRAAG